MVLTELAATLVRVHGDADEMRSRRGRDRCLTIGDTALVFRLAYCMIGIHTYEVREQTSHAQHRLAAEGNMAIHWQVAHLAMTLHCIYQYGKYCRE
eukprot:6172907-Pleurochrysis_carterae.AAC.2